MELKNEIKNLKDNIISRYVNGEINEDLFDEYKNESLKIYKKYNIDFNVQEGLYKEFLESWDEMKRFLHL